MGWEVYPDGLYETLCRVFFEYRFPKLYVAENGAAFPDVVEADGSVNDSQRIRYLHDHLQAAGRAIQAGVPLAGYFVWTLMDNFEWAHGYTKKFGMVHVDLETQQRTPKASADYYRRVIAANGVVDLP